MSKATFYVAPWSVAAAQQARNTDPPDERSKEPFFCHWSAVSWDALGSDPSQLVLGHVHWGAQWDARERFEAQPGVIPLGEAWDPVPPEAVPVLEALRQSYVDVRATRVGITTDTPTAPTSGAYDAAAPIDTAHTVGTALRKAVPSWAREIFG
jgi:hypothetical protein